MHCHVISSFQSFCCFSRNLQDIVIGHVRFSIENVHLVLDAADVCLEPILESINLRIGMVDRVVTSFVAIRNDRTDHSEGEYASNQVASLGT
jgi:hypothetical protein